MIKVTKQWELGHHDELWDEIVTWCIDQYGLDGQSKRWNTQATTTYMDFTFERETDAELFILKWM